MNPSARAADLDAQVFADVHAHAASTLAAAAP
jgi:hypothetical protein